MQGTLGSMFKTEAAITLLPTEPVATGLAGAISLSTAGGHFMKCTLCSPSLPGSVLGSWLDDSASPAPLSGIKPLVLISEISLSSMHSARGTRF